MRQKTIIALITFLLLSLSMLPGCQVQREVYAELEQLMSERFAADEPGVALLIDHPEAGEHIITVGLANLDRNEQLKSKNHLRIGDITKTFVSTLVFQMISEGVLALDDTLDQHVAPEIAAGIAGSDRVTIRHLLQMSSGIPDYRQQPDFMAAITADPMRKWRPEELLTYVYGQQLMQEPGSAYAYSNTNYILLHVLIVEEYDELLAEHMRDRILDILVMDDTYLEISEDLPVGYVAGYADLDGDGAYESTLDLGDARGLGDLGLISNVLNLAEFVPELYARTLLGDESRTTTLSTLPMPSGDAYGLGIMRRDTSWGPMWGHDNEQPGFAGQMWYLPDHETTVVALSNGIDKDTLADLVQDALAVVLATP